MNNYRHRYKTKNKIFYAMMGKWNFRIRARKIYLSKGDKELIEDAVNGFSAIEIKLSTLNRNES